MRTDDEDLVGSRQELELLMEVPKARHDGHYLQLTDSEKALVSLSNFSADCSIVVKWR